MQITNHQNKTALQLFEYFLFFDSNHLFFYGL